MEKRTIVILAKSVKHHNNCVAGKCVNTGEWIRPVSTPQGAELTDDQVRYENSYGTFHVKTLQKIEMQFTKHVPLVNQPDNYLISDVRWRQRYRIPKNELINHLDHPEDIWGKSDHVTFDLIINGDINIEQSLYLVKVENLKLYKNIFDKRRASFIYNEMQYDLSVTDPNFDKWICNEERFEEILCISLGENFRGKCYKIVATIF